jgi:hypothetical protein
MSLVLNALCRLGVVGMLATGTASAQVPTGAPVENVSSNTNFEHSCLVVADGYTAVIPGDPRLFVKWVPVPGGECRSAKDALRFGVTHENDHNTHFGSRNYDQNIVSYGADLDYKADLGHWLDARIVRGGDANILSVVLDTVNYDKTNVTGWPLRFGHLFAGITDPSVNRSLGQNLTVEFDVRVRGNEVKALKGYSGHRVMVGLLGTWDEAPPRANRAHFYEIDLIQSEGYTEHYGEALRPKCHDRIYDRCFYDESGKYAEGREVRYQTALQGAAPAGGADGWTHVRVPISAGFRELGWVSKPASWDQAKLTGLYIGIESVGATRAWIEIKNYRVIAVR